MMIRIRPYHLLLLLLLPVLGGCGSKKKRINERVTLFRKDKIPYGTFVAYENLKHIFPKAEIKVNKNSPDPYRDVDWRNISSAFSETSDVKKKKVRIILCQSVYPDTKEVNALVQKAISGEHIFISAFSISKELLDSFKLKVSSGLTNFLKRDSLTVIAKHPVTWDSASFTYPGFNYDDYVDSMDTEITTILGRDHSGDPDFVKFSYTKGGSISFHFAPLAFSNFFLLHKDNIRYYEYVLSQLPKNADIVYWDEYFRNPSRDFNSLSVILRNESLRWALWMTLAIFLLLFLFQSRRRQRIVPLLQPLRNTSLDFVKTIGRLYFQKRDNRNLAQKMVVHFTDHVRTKYNMPTSVLDDQFIDRLAFKSGFNREELKQIVYIVRTINDYPSYTDSELLNFNKKLENFYKQS